MTERELISEYIASGSAQAFAELVRQNAGMVYAAARRQIGDADLAEEVAQAVFILLARKSATIKGPLAGWLISTTYYAARNARKIANRRLYHERRASQMKLRESQTQPDAQWETYAPALDEAMARLGKKDRDAIAMRYLRGLSLREVGDAMGISEEAARKRVDRGLIRLRGILSARTIAPAVAILATHLAARGSETAPTKLVETMIASAASTGKGSLSADIVAKTAGAMSWRGSKVFAAVAAVLLLAGTGAGWFLVFSTENPSPAPPPAQPKFLPMSAEDQIELQTPGKLQLIRWDAMLSEEGDNAVMRIARPMPTPSMMYQAITCNAAQLHRAIADGMNNRDVELISSPTSVAFDMDNGMMFGGRFYFDFLTNTVSMISDANGREDGLLRVDNDHIKILLNFRKISVRLTTVDSKNNVASRGFTTAIIGQDTLAAGDVFAFVGGFDVGSGRTHYHLIVYETFRATSAQAGYAGELYDAGWWCRNGPAGLRQLADIAQVWKARIAHKPFLAAQLWRESCDVPAPFERKTVDGQSVRLISLCRPTKWRYCWWDPFGNPVAGDDNWLGYRDQNQPQPPAGTWAMIQVVGPPYEAKLATPTGRDVGGLGQDNVFRNIECEQIDNRPAGCDVGVMVGPWIEIASMKQGETKTVNGVSYQIPGPFGGEHSLVMFKLKRSGVLENEDFVTAVTRLGGEVECTGNPRQISVTGHNSSPRTVEDEIIFPLTLDQVAYFRILQRKRQWIHFSGYAAEPSHLPPQNVTTEEVQHANQILETREEQERTLTTVQSPGHT